MSKTTQDHDRIRKWAETRGAHPAAVKGTGKRGDPGILRLDFPGYRGKLTLKEISWDDFFKKFDAENLDFLYQEKTKSGARSNFSKLVHGDSARRRGAAARTRTRSATTTSSTRKKAAKKKTTTARTPARPKKTTRAKATRTTAPRTPRKAATTKRSSR